MASLSELVAYVRQRNRDRLTKRRERRRAKFRGSLAVLAIMKNEAMNIDEWISHYLQVGADRIVLIDNGSTDDTFAKTQAWVEKGKVDLISRHQRHRQREHYWEAISRFVLGKYEWLLIADLDEFWFCPDSKTIPAKLSEPQFDRLEVIYSNWRMFGSSGRITHPTSVRTGFVHCSEKLAPHQFAKFICRTARLTSRRNIRIHQLVGADSSKTVSDNENFHLFHYPIQSVEFFRSVKMTRGDVIHSSADTIRDMDYFRSYDAPCTIENRTLAELVEQGRLGAIGKDA